MMARIVKHCIVIVLYMFYKHAYLFSTGDLNFMLHGLSEFYVATLDTKLCFSVAMMARTIKPCIEIVLDMFHKHAH